VSPLSPLGKVGHVALVTENAERSLWFWRDVVGLEEVDHDGDTVFLRAWGDVEHHTLSLTPGSPSVVDHVAWRARRRDDVDEVAERLAAESVALEWLEAGQERGQGRAVRFELATGHRFELYHDVERAVAPDGRTPGLKTNAGRAWARGISPRRIDHVNVTTTDPGSMRDWLADKLGFGTRELIRLRDGTEAAIWLGVSALSHDIAVMTDAGGRSDGFHHLAYYLDDAQDVLRAADMLRENGIHIDGGPGRHGISQAIFSYARDPGSGHRLELFSGGYLVLDDDWEPIEWSEEELPTAMTWWGPNIAALPEMDVTTGFAKETHAGS
jgi:biphenyl-2,3-diol 1,2-dioxygenase